MVTVLAPNVNEGAGVVAGAATLAMKLKGVPAVVLAGVAVFTGRLKEEAAGVVVLVTCNEEAVIVLDTTNPSWNGDDAAPPEPCPNPSEVVDDNDVAPAPNPNREGAVDVAVKENPEPINKAP